MLEHRGRHGERAADRGAFARFDDVLPGQQLIECELAITRRLRRACRTCERNGRPFDNLALAIDDVEMRGARRVACILDFAHGLQPSCIRGAKHAGTSAKRAGLVTTPEISAPFSSVREPPSTTIASLVGRDVALTPCEEVGCTLDAGPYVRTAATISRTEPRIGLEGELRVHVLVHGLQEGAQERLAALEVVMEHAEVDPGGLGHLLVHLRLGRGESLALGDRVHDHVAPHLPLGHRRAPQISRPRPLSRRRIRKPGALPRRVANGRTPAAAARAAPSSGRPAAAGSAALRCQRQRRKSSRN